MSRIKKLILYSLFLIASILGIILMLERYPYLWSSFPHFEVFWKVYLDHFMAGFLLPIWIFIIFGGIILLFNRHVDLKNQKIFIFIGFIATMGLAIIWDFVLPFYYLIRVVIQNNYGFFAFVGALKLFYLFPRWEFIQFLFDWLGIFTAILYIKYFREDF